MAKTWKILLINIETGQESAIAISAPSRKEARKQFFTTNQNPYIKLIQVRKVKVSWEPSINQKRNSLTLGIPPLNSITPPRPRNHRPIAKETAVTNIPQYRLIATLPRGHVALTKYNGKEGDCLIYDTVEIFPDWYSANLALQSANKGE
jgi:hypothetical protein